ncbi:hypothetical protein THAOC_06192 [Thalassiosira oceanica]|uniref:Uncharacterized protein n=1 Tax=Thalassiosira oceanica TaxID=159749 RepID=K0T598_THAOC|nr:hypothetical protein THAOC_06192 [Thalassiosira oceanica]|eukprot:EJK72289.1 hypothetical protein THAOC_06192 [Thalassiosira oceanica]
MSKIGPTGPATASSREAGDVPERGGAGRRAVGQVRVPPLDLERAISTGVGSGRKLRGRRRGSRGRSSSPAVARRVRSPGTSSTSWAAAWDPRRPGPRASVACPGRERRKVTVEVYTDDFGGGGRQYVSLVRTLRTDGRRPREKRGWTMGQTHTTINFIAEIHSMVFTHLSRDAQEVISRDDLERGVLEAPRRALSTRGSDPADPPRAPSLESCDRKSFQSALDPAVAVASASDTATRPRPGGRGAEVGAKHYNSSAVESAGAPSKRLPVLFGAASCRLSQAAVPTAPPIITLISYSPSPPCA